MNKTLAELSTEEFEIMIGQAIDKRLEIWLTQLMDALSGEQQEEKEFRPEFAASLKRSLEQMHSGEGVDIRTIRDRICG